MPATSANLGPGFDALGLALALHNEVEAEEADRTVVRVDGEGAGRLATTDKNVVARGVRMAFEAAGRPFKGVALTCVNRVPASTAAVPKRDKFSAAARPWFSADG